MFSITGFCVLVSLMGMVSAMPNEVATGHLRAHLVHRRSNGRDQTPNPGKNKTPVRITTMASPEMILISRKEEYMSKVGLAMLYYRAGGSLTAEMRDIITNGEKMKPHTEHLIKELRSRWNEWDLKEENKGDDMLNFDSFYNGFMAPYFSCYRCSDTTKALQAMDMDNDNQVDWNEFLVYLNWAIHEYPDIKDADTLLEVAFLKRLIHAVQETWTGVTAVTVKPL